MGQEHTDLCDVSVLVSLNEKEFEKFSNSTNELRKKAEEILNKIDEYGTRERQMSKAIDNMENINKEKR